MATVNVFVGQCGNQVGTDFLRSVASSIRLSSSGTSSSSSSSSSSLDQQQQQHEEQNDARMRRTSSSSLLRQLEPWDDASSLFRNSNSSASKNSSSSHSNSNYTFLPRARAVCIDMEPKVIRTCDIAARSQTPDGFCLPPEKEKSGRVTRSSGSGNNWACGYITHGKKVREDIVDALRKEVLCVEQEQEHFAGFHVVHSIAGGTGSGVGSLTSDLIREHFGSKVPLVHTVVWPFEHGELSPQWLNCALTLRVLDETADACHIISNDVAVQDLSSSPVFANRSLSRKNISVPWSCVNAWMAREMAALWSPSIRHVPVGSLLSASVASSSSSSSPSSSRNQTVPIYRPDYLPPLTFADRIYSLCPSSKRIFFESAGTVAVLDNRYSKVHHSSPSRNSESEYNEMLMQGTSSNSFHEALNQSLRTIERREQQLQKQQREKKKQLHWARKEETGEEEQDEDEDGYQKQSETGRGGEEEEEEEEERCFTRYSDLIVCHGTTAPLAWMPPNGNRLVEIACAAATTSGSALTVGVGDTPIEFPKLHYSSKNNCNDNNEENENGSYDENESSTKDSSSSSSSSSSLSFYSNSSSIAGRIERAMTAAELLVTTNAFIHHFTQRGLEEEDLMEAVIHSYEIATRYGLQL